MTHMIHRTAVMGILAGALIFTGMATAQSPDRPQSESDSKMAGSASHKGMNMKGADSKFVMEAAQGGMAEVQIGQLAAQKASDADVKQFGQRIVDDHSKANDQLKSVASQKGMTLPSGIGAKNQATYDRLSKLSGMEFDHAFIQHMVMDHKKDVADFQKEANSGKDQDVKAFASQTLPTLQEHLKMVQDLNGKMGGSSNSADRAKSKAKSSDMDRNKQNPDK